MKLFVLLLLVFVISVLGCKREQTSVEHLVEANWPEATALLDEFHSHLDNYFAVADDRLLASAIVFPELLRYSKLRDKIETEALKTLYVQYGVLYANFSIGPFQMKPSFAEDLEKACLKKQLCSFLPSDTLSTVKARLNRIKRLTNSEGQVHYLFSFIQLMNLKFEAYKFESLSERVSLYAIAYQAGYSLNIAELKKKQNERHYHTDIWPNSKTQFYNYSDIALYYYSK
jgi:hypothetical protein